MYTEMIEKMHASPLQFATSFQLCVSKHPGEHSRHVLTNINARSHTDVYLIGRFFFEKRVVLDM